VNESCTKMQRLKLRANGYSSTQLIPSIHKHHTNFTWSDTSTSFRGRNYITNDDLSLPVKVVLSTASIDRQSIDRQYER